VNKLKYGRPDAADGDFESGLYCTCTAKRYTDTGENKIDPAKSTQLNSTQETSTMKYIENRKIDQETIFNICLGNRPAPGTELKSLRSGNMRPLLNSGVNWEDRGPNKVKKDFF